MSALTKFDLQTTDFSRSGQLIQSSFMGLVQKCQIIFMFRITVKLIL